MDKKEIHKVKIKDENEEVLEIEINFQNIWKFP
jgi:hypothetical protein